MKKSDHKKKSREAKNSEKQRKHVAMVKNKLAQREDRQTHYLNQMVKKTQATVEQNSKDERIKDQLRRNMEILEALEKQMSEEEKSKAKINAELESKGLNTLEEKMDYLHKQQSVEEKIDLTRQQGTEERNKETLGIDGQLREVCEKNN